MNSINGDVFNTRTYQDDGFGLHFHKSFELIYVLEGEMSLNVGKRQYALKKNDFAMILPYEIHSFYVPEGSRAWIAVFSEGYAKTFSKLEKHRSFESAVFSCRDSVRVYFEGELANRYTMFFGKPGDEMTFTIKSCLYAVLGEYFRNTPSSPKNQSEADLPAVILDYISEHFGENISLRGIAQEFGYNYQYLSRVFNNAIGVNFKTLLNHYRYEYAYGLLTETDKSITEIVFESGFQSVRSFNRICLDISGQTPSEIRRK